MLRKRLLVLHGMSSAIVLGFALVAWWHLTEKIEITAVEITAALDVPERGLPVWAQFEVTQTLELSAPVTITKMVIPLYVPEQLSEPLIIELWRYDTLVQRWHYQPEKTETVTPITFSLTPPRLLDGKMAVRFNGAAIPYQDQGKAPRIFIESSDEYYSPGNYYVAQNKKQGDVALRLYHDTTRFNRFLASLRQQPGRALNQFFSWLLLALLAGVAPYIFMIEIQRGSQERNRDKAPDSNDKT
jgi:hypothetical protein